MKKFVTILILTVLIGSVLQAEDFLPTVARIRTMLQQELKLSETEAAGVMTLLRARLRLENRTGLSLDRVTAEAVLKLCKRNRIRVSEVAGMLAAADGYMYRMRSSGEPVKDARRSMYMTMSREMKKSGTATGEGVAARVRTALQQRLRTAAGDGTGSGQMIRNRSRYYGERGYNGSRGGKRDTAAGPH